MEKRKDRGKKMVFGIIKFSSLGWVTMKGIFHNFHSFSLRLKILSLTSLSPSLSLSLQFIPSYEESIHPLHQWHHLESWVGHERRFQTGRWKEGWNVLVCICLVWNHSSSSFFNPKGSVRIESMKEAKAKERKRWRRMEKERIEKWRDGQLRRESIFFHLFNRKKEWK